MSIALIGATGRTGRLVAEKLHRAGIPFRALLRDEAQRAHFEGLDASPVIVDLAQDFCAALAGVHAVIFAAGSAETEGAEKERQIDRDAIIKAVNCAKRYVRTASSSSAPCWHTPPNAPQMHFSITPR
ncbi:YhfK-like protein [Caballeronia arationis]|nr:NAD(P)H-binding protein [Caballeronia arationis]SAL07880.1 YhfK-like protein [Caballeronia arationis]